ncbi:MAG: hypothetical protein PHD10_01895 [Bacilli bacterium]|nr:hypothetical protein [Bacilli bacterium]MDD4607875.1 hypothetical protein [Bacilli bacterium]
MKNNKKYIIPIILLIVIGILVYFYFNKDNKTDNNDDNKLPVQKEEIKLNAESLKILVEQVYNESLKEIEEANDDYKDIEKMLYSKVIKNCKGKALPSDVKAMIKVVYTEKNK